MLLEVVTNHSGYYNPYRFNVNQFQSFPMNLKSTIVLEGDWSFEEGDFDQFQCDPDISINEHHELIINNKMVFTSQTSDNQCMYCGTVVEVASSLCYNCRSNSDKMYYFIREGLAYYKYDKRDK